MEAIMVSIHRPKHIFDLGIDLGSQIELRTPNAANFCPTFFWLRFSLLCYSLPIGIGELDNDV